MNQWMAQLQPLLIGGVLLWAGTLKLTSRHSRALAIRSALAAVVGKERAPMAYRVVGVAEVLVACLFLLPPVYPVEGFAGAALSVGFLGYLGYARIFAPDSSCGCLSSKPDPITWRSFGRPVVLLAASLLAVQATGYWAAALVDRPLAGTALLAAELALVVVLSPELDRSWLLPLRKLIGHFRPHPLAGMAYDLPLESTLQQLYRSNAYLQAAGALRSDVLDHWDEGEWRLVSYAAVRDEQRVTAVFAVPRLRYEPDEIRVALVDEPEPELVGTA